MKKSMMAAVMGMAVFSGAGESLLRGEESDEVIMRRLNSMVLSVDFQGVSPSEAIDYLRDASGINVVISSGALTHLEGEDRLITLKVRDLRLRSILKLLLADLELHAVMKHGVVSIVTEEDVKKNVVLRIFDVRDLQLQIEHFPGPEIELNYEDERVGVIITEREEPEIRFTDDLLMELVETMTGGNSWRENDRTGLNIHNGRLIVTQTPAVQGQIHLLLEKLRQYQ